jgi:hypothetical protein
MAPAYTYLIEKQLPIRFDNYGKNNTKEKGVK